MNTNTSMAQGSPGVKWTRLQTYTTIQDTWSKIWESIEECEVKACGSINCKVLAEHRCPNHATLVPSSIDFSQDGRPRLRTVCKLGEKKQITGRPPGSMRHAQRNVRMLLNVFSFFRRNPNHVPFPGDVNPETKQRHEYSHLCLRPYCFNGDHLTYESRPQNRDRERCNKDICHLRVTHGMEPHVPPCILSAEEVMVTFNEVKNYRATRFPNWQKRGSKKSRGRNNRSDHESDEEAAEEKHNEAEQPNRPSPKRRKKNGDGNREGVQITQNKAQPASTISNRGKITSFFLPRPPS